MGRWHLLAIWQAMQAAIAALGAPGLLALSFLDSTILPFPSANDLMLIDLSIHSPLRMPIYAAFATMGSALGCMVLFTLARKGEQITLTERSARMQRIHRWIARNGFFGVIVGALLPPPMPFKLVVLAAGALEMPPRSFILAVMLARAVRFYGEGTLAVHYGEAAVQMLSGHRVVFGMVSAVTMVVFYLAFRSVWRARHRRIA